MKRLPSFLVLAALAGCALTRNAPPLEIRYFSPELPAPAPTLAFASTGEAIPLRLGQVDRSDVLGHRIVQRTSPVELALYETRRWTERPDEYVRRALLDALFEARPFARALAGPAPTLDVEILAFEEVLAPRHLGRVRLRYVLHDRRAVLASGQLVAEAAVVGDDFDAVVRAIATANRDAAAQLADRVQGQLCASPPTH
jgi:cholesterol transport system auxiliary component